MASNEVGNHLPHPEMISAGTRRDNWQLKKKFDCGSSDYPWKLYTLLGYSHVRRLSVVAGKGPADGSQTPGYHGYCASRIRLKSLTDSFKIPCKTLMVTYLSEEYYPDAVDHCEKLNASLGV
jgi:hypothetical protein